MRKVSLDCCGEAARRSSSGPVRLVIWRSLRSHPYSPTTIQSKTLVDCR